MLRYAHLVMEGEKLFFAALTNRIGKFQESRPSVIQTRFLKCKCYLIGTDDLEYTGDKNDFLLQDSSGDGL